MRFLRRWLPARPGAAAVSGPVNEPAELRWPPAEVRCPQCGGSNLRWEFACHTYPIGEGERQRWSSCLPCDSAVLYYCAAGSGLCWAYTHGLNPANPRAAANEQRRPPWLPEKLPHSHGMAQARPEIPHTWDREDDDDAS